jgi:lipopolysaccharide export LptBFGC system permease protein LptF
VVDDGTRLGDRLVPDATSGETMNARRFLKPLGSLDLYVGKLFLSSYATALLLVVGLFWVLDLATHLDDFLDPWPDGRQAPTRTIVEYYILNMPYLFLQVAPFVTLVAGMFVVNRLLRNNEVVAALNAGISAHRLLMPIFVGALVAAAGMFGIREWLAVGVAEKRDALLDVLVNKREDQVYQELCLRNIFGSFLRLGEFRPGLGQARDFMAIMRGDNHVDVSVIADEATWTGNSWALTNGKKYFTGTSREMTAVSTFYEPGFTPEMALTFRRARDNPLELSFGEVRELIRREPENYVYLTLWQYHLTFPLANLVLLLVGIPVLLGYERGRGTERTALGGLLCLFYFGTDFVFRSLGLGGVVRPDLASWMPILIFGSLGVVLYDSMKT